MRVRVDLVAAPVTVRDNAGELVLRFGKEDFRLYDNGVEQDIEDFDLGGEPLSVVFVMETSSRVEPLLEAVRRAGIVFTENVLGQTGAGAVLGFHDTVEEIVGFTPERERIEKAIKSLKVGTSGAVLYDAMLRGVNLLEAQPPGRRRVMILVAEAADTGSEAKLGEALRAAQLANVTIYSVGLSTTAALLKGQNTHRGPSPITPEGTFPMPPRPGTAQTPSTEQARRGNLDLAALVIWVVERLANAAAENSLEIATAGTGGAHFATFRDASIERAVSQIGAELHAQYTLTYRPRGVAAAGFHQIKVELVTANRKDFTVRTRPGYFLAP